MKKLIVLLVMFAAAANCFADATTDGVAWAGTGDWMTEGNWTDAPDGGTWAIPGWVGNGGTVPWNPNNTGHSTSPTWNVGYAYINNGICNLTPTSKPDGEVDYIYMGSATGDSATLNISDNLTVTNKFYTAHIAGTTTNVNQTAGNVTSKGNFIIAEKGSSAYALSGGSLTANGEKGYMGSNSGASGTFTLTDSASFTACNTLNSNQGIMFIGYQSGGTAVVNLRDNASFTVTTSSTIASRVDIGTYGQTTFNQSGGHFTAEKSYLGYYASGQGTYKISGGDYLTSLVTVLKNNSEFNVIGSGADSIRMARLDAGGTVTGTKTLSISLDADGSTLIEVFGTEGTYSGATLAGAVLQVDTLAGFDGHVNDVYEVLWSAAGITTTGMTFTNLSTTQFSWAVVDKAYNGTDGKMLQLTVVPEPATIVMLAFGSLLFARRRHG